MWRDFEINADTNQYPVHSLMGQLSGHTFKRREESYTGMGMGRIKKGTGTAQQRVLLFGVPVQEKLSTTAYVHYSTFTVPKLNC